MTDEQKHAIEHAQKVLRAVKLYELAASLVAPTQGADARPVAIYQSRLHTDDEGTWSDGYEATFYACKAYPDKYATRIVYAIRDAAPSEARIASLREALLIADSYQTVLEVGRRIEALIAAIAPREKT